VIHNISNISEDQSKGKKILVREVPFAKREEEGRERKKNTEKEKKKKETEEKRKKEKKKKEKRYPPQNLNQSTYQPHPNIDNGRDRV
jgi:hypothetical protein